MLKKAEISKTPLGGTKQTKISRQTVIKNQPKYFNMPKKQASTDMELQGSVVPRMGVTTHSNKAEISKKDLATGTKPTKTNSFCASSVYRPSVCFCRLNLRNKNFFKSPELQ